MTETKNHSLAWSNQNYVLFGSDQHLQIIRNLPNYVFILQYQDKLWLTQKKNFGKKNWIFPQISVNPNDHKNITNYLKEIIEDNWQAKAVELTNLGTLYPAESELNALDVLLLAKTSNPPVGGLLATRDDLNHFIANDSIKDSVTLASLMKIAQKSPDFGQQMDEADL